MRTSAMWVVCAVAACSSPEPVAKPPDAAKSTVTLDRTTLPVTEELATTVKALDADGTAVQNASVSFELSGTGNEGGNPMASTGFDGTLVHRLRSSKPETKTLTTTVTLAGKAVVLDAKPSVTFVPGPPFEVKFESQTVPTVDAGSLFPPIRIVVKDSKGNIAPTPSLSIALRLVEGTAGAVLSGGAAKDTVDGGVVFDMVSVDRPGTGYGLQLRQQGGAGYADETMRFDVR